MIESYKRKSFESNYTKKKNQRGITTNENVKHIQNIIKFKETKNFQVKRSLKTEFCNVKFLRGEQ